MLKGYSCQEEIAWCVPSSERRHGDGEKLERTIGRGNARAGFE
jgi:hypothetical protein